MQLYFVLIMQRRLSGDAYLEQIATTKDVIFRDFRSVPVQRRSSLQYAQHTTLPTAAAVASRNSSTQFAPISARTKSTREESRQALGGPQPRFKLSASSLFPLNGQEQTDLASSLQPAAPIGGRRGRSEY
jgi:hypothetical protein